MKIFVEEQKFNLILVILIHAIALVSISVTTYYHWSAATSASFSETLAALSGLIFIVLLALLFLFMKLKTRVDEIGIHYQFLPFHLNFKTVPWEIISTCYLRKYNAISEFGGWGMKFSFFGRTGKSFTTRGNIGLQLVLKNGKKVLIGTQKKEALQRILNTYQNKIESVEK